jgi:hypothetical protein
VTQPAARRPSIAERAEKRERLTGGGRDRYASLLRALQAGRELPIGRREGVHYVWHPIAWRLVRIALLLVAAWLVARVGFGILRENSVYTWSGPDASVRSGQRLEGCAPVNVLDDDVYPTWVRFEGAIYKMTGLKRPVPAPTLENGYRQTGYSLGSVLLLTVEREPTGTAGRHVVLLDPVADVGELYVIEPDCH